MGMIGGLTHMIFHGIMKFSLFFAVGAIMHQTGKHYIYEIAGLAKKMPVVFGCMSVAGIALIGIPPLTGFTILGKAYLVEPTDDDGKTNCDPGWQMKVPMVLFAILIIVFGLYSKPLMTFFTWVANGLL